jgi:hypothetical protein
MQCFFFPNFVIALKWWTSKIVSKFAYIKVNMKIKKFQWQVIGTGIGKIFLKSFVWSSMNHSKENLKNNYLIFKPNYFIFLIIITSFSYELS